MKNFLQYSMAFSIFGMAVLFGNINPSLDIVFIVWVWLLITITTLLALAKISAYLSDEIDSALRINDALKKNILEKILGYTLAIAWTAIFISFHWDVTLTAWLIAWILAEIGSACLRDQIKEAK